MYSHSVVMHYIWQETGHWKQGWIGVNLHPDGSFTSGERIRRVRRFNKQGKGPNGAYLDLSTLTTCTS